MNAVVMLLSLLLAGAQPAIESSAREGFINADDGARLYYRIEGEGPATLIVVHGGPGNSLESVRPDFGPLARGRRVIYYDQRGNGRSELVALSRVGIDRQVADLEDLRRHFGLERMALLGNSWGGLLVSAYAAAHPDRVERLILHAPAPPTRFYLDALNAEFARRAEILFSEDEQSRIRAGLSNWSSVDDPRATCRFVMASFLRLYAFDPRVEPPIRGDVCAGPIEAVRRQRLVNNAIWESMGDFDLRATVGRVQAPVLVIYGETDAIPAASARDWAASYADARLMVVPRTGHLVHIERPELFFPAVDQFLTGGWPSSAERVEGRGARGSD
jgi:proline iminopeptidase